MQCREHIQVLKPEASPEEKAIEKAAQQMKQALQALTPGRGRKAKGNRKR